MDIGYSLWEQGLDWFQKAPGGVNRWSVGAFLVLAIGLIMFTHGIVGRGFSGAPGQIGRFALGVVSFILGIAGFFGFLLIVMGSFMGGTDLPPFGKESLACLAAAVLGFIGIAKVIKAEGSRRK